MQLAAAITFSAKGEAVMDVYNGVAETMDLNFLRWKINSSENLCAASSMPPSCLFTFYFVVKSVGWMKLPSHEWMNLLNENKCCAFEVK